MLFDYCIVQSFSVLQFRNLEKLGNVFHAENGFAFSLNDSEVIVVANFIYPVI